MLRAAPELAAHRPIAPFTPEIGQQPAAVQDGTALPIEALLRPRPDRLRSVNSIPQTEHGAVTGEIDCRLDRGAGLNGDRIVWTR